jgi:hypothetical protein
MFKQHLNTKQCMENLIQHCMQVGFVPVPAHLVARDRWDLLVWGQTWKQEVS